MNTKDLQFLLLRLCFGFLKVVFSLVFLFSSVTFLSIVFFF